MSARHIVSFGDPDRDYEFIEEENLLDTLISLHALGYTVYRWFDGLTWIIGDPDDVAFIVLGVNTRKPAAIFLSEVDEGYRRGYSGARRDAHHVAYVEPFEENDLVHQILLDEYNHRETAP